MVVEYLNINKEINYYGVGVALISLLELACASVNLNPSTFSSALLTLF